MRRLQKDTHTTILENLVYRLKLEPNTLIQSCIVPCAPITKTDKRADTTMRVSYLTSDEMSFINKHLPDVEGVRPMRSFGRNSTLFELKLRHNERAVFKRYREDARRNRLQSEVAAIAHIQSFNKAIVPDIIAADDKAQRTLMTFVEGEPSPALTLSCFQKFIDFQIALDNSASSESARQIQLAAEACLRISNMVDDLWRRQNDLMAVSSAPEPARRYIAETLPFHIDKLTTNARRHLKDINNDDDYVVDRTHQTLIVSDFGAHNCIRKPGGEIVFIDFEFFGWDSPITAIANFVLHPAMLKTPAYNLTFQETMLKYFDRIPSILQNYWALLPLYSLRWSLITLNAYKGLKDGNTIESWSSEKLLQQFELSKSYLEKAINFQSRVLL